MTLGTSPTVYTDFQGLEALRRKARDHSPEALRAAAREFEALFLQMMLKGMREASLGEGVFDSEQGNFYRDMFDKQVAIQLSRSQGLGLADVLVRQLGGDAPSAGGESSAPDSGPPAPPFATPRDFIERLQAPARAAAARLGVDPAVLLAQAALESGWGRREIRMADGSSSHNLFGIKAGPDWEGPRVTATTLEYRDGVARKEQAVFRAYGSYEESFRDYADFLLANARYGDALAAAEDPSRFLRALQAAGYATDPAYADKIESIMAREVVAVLGAAEVNS